MKENDFLRIRFDVFPTNPSGESEATGNPTFPSNGRNLTCLAAENQLQERNAHEFASRIPSTVPGACTLIGFRPQVRIRPTIVHAENTNA
jgi:hypothetical protein